MNPSLECELARVQMKRYLGGEELPSQLMEELEQHVHACASCSHYLDAQRLKLAAKLSGGKVKEAKAPTGPKDTDVFTKPRQVWLTPKTMGLAAALALVLFAMSAVAKDPTLLFGPKASTARPAEGLAGGSETAPDAESGEEAGSEREKSAENEKSGDQSHPSVGQIMTGETVQKEIDASLNEDPQSETEQTPEGDAEKPAKGSEPGKESASSQSAESEPAKPSAAHSETDKPAATPVKEPDMALVVAEEGKPAKKASPAPHPRVAPSSPKVRKSSHRTLSRRSNGSRRTSEKPRVSHPSSGGSVRVYDSAGNPIN